MSRRIAVCSVVILLAVFGTAACAGGEGKQEEVEILKERVELLEEQVRDLQIIVGEQVMDEPLQEQTQPEQTQPEDTLIGEQDSPISVGYPGPLETLQQRKGGFGVRG